MQEVSKENILSTQDQPPTKLLDAIHELTELLASGLDLNEILHRVVGFCKEISNATVSSIFLANEQKTELTMYAQTGYQEDLRGEATYPLTISEEDVLTKIDNAINSKEEVPDDSPLRIGLTAWIFRSGKRVSIKSNEELRKHPAWKGKYDGRQYAQSSECSSLVGVPLVVEKDVIGILKVEQKRGEEKFFTPDEEYAFEFFSGFVALVVKTARLMEQRERLTNLLTNLYRFGALLHEQENYERLLHIFLTGLTHGELLSLNRAVFFEFRPDTQQLIGKRAIGPINKDEGEEIRKKMEREKTTPDDCISEFDKYGGYIPSKLQDKVKEMEIDLDSLCMWLSLIEKKEKSIHIISEKDHLSPQIDEFLKSIDAEKVLMIVSPPIFEESVFVVLCDNIYDKKGFDDLTIELLNPFVDLTARALQRFYHREEVMRAKGIAWQEAAGSAAHRLGQILPIIDHRLREIENTPIIVDDKNFLQETLEYVIKAEEVVRDFRRFTGKVRLDKLGVYTPKEMFEEIERFLKQTHKDIDFQFNFNIKKEVPGYVNVDIDELNQQVIESLVKNSIEAKDKGLKIIVGINLSSSDELKKFNLPETKDYITLSIKDNGAGIPRENKERIFQPFFSTKTRGTGLGLSTAKRIIEAHKGIIIEDGILSQGVLFKIFIPIYKGGKE